jgi:acetoacetyl-CoA synthase
MGAATGIVATGSYLPRRVVTNDEIAARLDVTPEWIERKTHIRSRRFAAPEEAASDLAVRAARAALENSGIPLERLGYLVVATSTGDHPQPPTSYLVQHALGAHDIACFDINVVCSGFVYGLQLARGLLALHPDRLAMVIGVDVYSRVLDFTDRRTAVLFADGAGAAILGAVPDPYGVVDVDLISRGDAHELIRVEAGGSRRPASTETLAEGAHFFRMNGRAVRDFVNENLPTALRDLVKRSGVTLDQVDHFVPHQANGVMLNEIVETTGLTNATTHRTVERFGNVGSASLPVTLDHANTTNQLRDGDLVLLSGFGGGMSIGSALLRWTTVR